MRSAIMAIMMSMTVISCMAASMGDLYACDTKFRNAFFPYFPINTDAKNIQIEEIHAKDGIYKAAIRNTDRREYVGILFLDVIKEEAYDIYKRKDNPRKLDIKNQELKLLIDTCLNKNNIVVTKLPLASNETSCIYPSVYDSTCGADYHQYPMDWLPNNVSKQILLSDQKASSARWFFLLPKFLEFDVFLVAKNDSFGIYVFKKDHLISHEQIESSIDFHISNDYLITTYIGTNKNSLQKATLKKLNSNGELINCPDLHSSCE